MSRNQLLFVTILLLSLLASSFVASAQSRKFTETFTSQTNGANAGGCNTNTAPPNWCAFVGIDQGPSAPGTTTSTFLFYDFVTEVGNTVLDVSGFGNIPTADVTISGLGSATLNVDTSTVSGFFSQFCSFDVTTSVNTCSNDFPIVSMNLKANGLFRSQFTTVTTSTFFRNVFMSEGTFTGHSASGGIGITDQFAGNQSFSNLFGEINQGQNVQISVF